MTLRPCKWHSIQPGNPRFPIPSCSLPTAKFSTRIWERWTFSNCAEQSSRTSHRTTSASMNTGSPVLLKMPPGKVAVNKFGFQSAVGALGGSMRKHLLLLLAAISSVCVLLIPQPCLGDEIPKIAWRRPIGQPLENPGVRKNKSDIDDGYWQGAPVGGFGAGTFSRTYRGDFARWHIKSGVHQ